MSTMRESHSEPLGIPWDSAHKKSSYKAIPSVAGRASSSLPPPRDVCKAKSRRLRIASSSALLNLDIGGVTIVDIPTLSALSTAIGMDTKGLLYLLLSQNIGTGATEAAFVGASRVTKLVSCMDSSSACIHCELPPSPPSTPPRRPKRPR